MCEEKGKGDAGSEWYDYKSLVYVYEWSKRTVMCEKDSDLDRIFCMYLCVFEGEGVSDQSMCVEAFDKADTSA